MASIIEYEEVVERMRQLQMHCQYYNSGAFGFDPSSMHYVGWLGPPDPTIRPAAMQNAIQVAEPFVSTLAARATRAWQTLFAGPAWIMPRSHWAYELDFGSKPWLPAALATAGIDSTHLEKRTNAAAVEFGPSEAALFTPFVESLLTNLLGSDFSLAFSSFPVIATLHHHKQVWWMSSEPATIEHLRSLGSEFE